MIDDIKKGLGKLRSWSIEQVKKDVNSTAYCLTQEAISCIINKV